MVQNIEFIGWLLMFLAAAHVAFPRYFDWPAELGRISLINRQMMYVHTFFIAFGVFLMGLLCVSSSHELVYTALGRRISLGLGVFWGARLTVQFLGYSPALWRGKAFETAVHILFSLMWLYLSTVFLWTGALV